MKMLSMILAVFLLASCAGMRDTSGAGTTGEGLSGPDAAGQPNFGREDDPSDIYFGGT